MRTELVSASVGEPGKQTDLVRIDEAGSRRITDQGEGLLFSGVDADLIGSRQEGDEAELGGLQGMIRVVNAYRAVDEISVADLLNRRKHRIDMIV
jgi:hypothetical protein